MSRRRAHSLRLRVTVVGDVMVIDNDIYNRLGGTWWDEDSPLAALHGSMTVGRMRYFCRVLAQLDRLPRGAGAVTALDIGSGGGFLAEEFCRLGFTVTGVEPSEVSVRTARAHAAAAGLNIDYRVGVGERLPEGEDAFDVVYCCDVLEHVNDVDRVLAETARVLRPGGVYLFDTPNRTLAAKLVTKASQQWRLTRVIDAQAHDWTMFLRPEELAAQARRHGLQVHEIVGLGPRAGAWTVLTALRDLRRDRLSYLQVSERLDMGRTRSTRFFYMGYAVAH
jgi:2-polyprenyl-6-hydroxyphenyl methylase / 3-demethylubiquinone-9 3-methyltransferase